MVLMVSTIGIFYGAGSPPVSPWYVRPSSLSSLHVGKRGDIIARHAEFRHILYAEIGGLTVSYIMPVPVGDSLKTRRGAHRKGDRDSESILQVGDRGSLPGRVFRSLEKSKRGTAG
jgi:hypothetical protein